MFYTAVMLRFGLMKKEAHKLAFQYGKAHGVVMQESWESSESAGNIWLRRLRKHHESLSVRKPEATCLP